MLQKISSKQNLAIIFLIFLFIQLVPASSHDNNSQENKSKHKKRTHSGGFDLPANWEISQIEDIIREWDATGALNMNSGTVCQHRNGMRIDLQQIEYHDDIPFERFAIQRGSRTFAVIHIQRGIVFGTSVIRTAFRQSLATGTHVYLSSVKQEWINLPKTKDDEEPYRRRIFIPHWTRTAYFVWGINQVVNQFYNKWH